MAQEKIGSSINQEVVNQIEARKKIIGKTDGRTNDELLYLNSKTSWIRLSSGVNTLTDAEAQQLKNQQGRTTIKGSNTLAGYNILQGGVLNPNRTIREGISLSTTVGEDTSDDKAAYRNRINTTGIRPMPGITGMTVASKNTFGTLREAEVKISVWTLEDFEMIDRIYLRPGFTLILEWGHSIYVTNEGAIEKSPPVMGTAFFTNGTSISSINSTLIDFRKTSNYNYDFIIGYVKNFSWSYNPAGCYECTVTIIAKGEILDSLKIAINPLKKGVPATDLAAGSSKRGKRQRKSAFHFFFSKLESITDPVFNTDRLLPSATGFIPKIINSRVYYQCVQFEDLPGTFLGFETSLKDAHIPHYYLPLRVYLEIFNNFGTLVDNTKQGTVDYPIIKFNIDYEKSSKFLTFPQHFSIDPSVCVLEHKHVLPPGVTDWEFGGVECVYENLVTLTYGYDDVLNILVPTYHFEKILDSALDEKGEFTKGGTEIFTELLGTINTALGGINDLDLYYDEEVEGGMYFIVDRNNITQKAPPKLTITGIDSVFTDIGISSKISNQISSNIAIAAQGSSQTFSKNTENILEWNPKVVDRFIVTKDDNVANAEGEANLKAEQEEKLKQWYDDVINFFGEFNSTGFQDSDINAAKTLFNDYIKYWLHYNKVTSGQTSTLPVPVELNLQLEGIGGLKIGQVFTISSGVLPQNYDRFGYIITGLDHSVENNRWLTNIKTQFYSIGNTSPASIPNTPGTPSTTTTSVEKNVPSTTQKTSNTKVKATSGYGNPKNFLPFLKGDWVERAVFVISKLEGFSKVPKWDYNKLRAGYGTDLYVSAPGAKPVAVTSSTRFTETTAKLTLDYDIRNRFYKAVTNRVGKSVFDKLNDNQKAALISFAYNAGGGAFGYNGLDKAVISTSFGKVPDIIRLGPITAKDTRTGIKKVLQPLVNRRNLEAEIFSTPV